MMMAPEGSAAQMYIAGIDEVGRGCLAGPVFAAAVVLAENHWLTGLRDSKALSAGRREQLKPLIEENALAWAIGMATVEEIDEINILRATFLAMRRAVSALSVVPTMCLVDGNQNPSLGCPTRTIIGGDGIEPSIMAASILAKVARDAALTELDVLHPQYGFARHKGYGTRQHLEAIRLYGPSRIHRKSFAPCRPAHC